MESQAQGVRAYDASRCLPEVRWTTRAEYYRHDSAWRYLRRFPHSHPAEQRIVEGHMARLKWAAPLIAEQHRLVWVLRAYFVKRCIKLAARKLVLECFEQLRDGVPPEEVAIPRTRWRYGVTPEEMAYAREHGLAAFAEMVLETLDAEDVATR